MAVTVFDARKVLDVVRAKVRTTSLGPGKSTTFTATLPTIGLTPDLVYQRGRRRCARPSGDALRLESRAMATTAELPRLPQRVVVVGGGFAGLNAARSLGIDPEVRLTLVDRRNFHLFQPLLYQVATGALSPGDIASLCARSCASTRTPRSSSARPIGIDVERREVQLADGGPIPYDTLVVATGAHHTYFDHPEWAAVAPGLKTLEDATEIRRRILIGFEAAEREATRIDGAPG